MQQDNILRDYAVRHTYIPSLYDEEQSLAVYVERKADARRAEHLAAWSAAGTALEARSVAPMGYACSVEVGPHEGLLVDFDADLNFLNKIALGWAEDFESGPYPLASTNAVRSWLADFVREYSREYEEAPPVPTVTQSEEMSIDLMWELDAFTLLVNFPENETEPCTFYGFSASGADTEWWGKSAKSKLASAIKGFIGIHINT